MNRAHRQMFGYLNALNHGFTKIRSQVLGRFAFLILSKEITKSAYVSVVKIRMKSYPVLNIDPEMPREPIDEGCLATGIQHALLYRTLVTGDCVEED